jgi:hypothetical protein
MTLPSAIVMQTSPSYMGSLTRIKKRSKQLYAAMICLRQGRLFDSDRAIYQTRSIDSLIDIKIRPSIWPTPEIVDCWINQLCDCIFVVLSMKRCVHITTCFVWQHYFICRPTYIYIYIYIGVHIKPSFKTKTGRDLQSALRTKWGKSIVINFSLFSSLWF